MSFWLSQKGSCVFGRWSTSFAPAGATSAMVNWLPPACTREPDQVQCWTRLPDLNPAPAGCRSGQVDTTGERCTLLGGIAEAVPLIGGILLRKTRHAPATSPSAVQEINSRGLT